MTLAAAPEDKVAYAADVLLVGTLAVEVCPLEQAEATPAKRRVLAE
jgi:hypothetical protein